MESTPLAFLYLEIPEIILFVRGFFSKPLTICVDASISRSTHRWFDPVLRPTLKFCIDVSENFISSPLRRLRLRFPLSCSLFLFVYFALYRHLRIVPSPVFVAPYFICFLRNFLVLRYLGGMGRGGWKPVLDWVQKIDQVRGWRIEEEDGCRFVCT